MAARRQQQGGAGGSVVGAPSLSNYLLLTAIAPALLAVVLGLSSSMTAPVYPVPARGSAVVITGTSTGPCKIAMQLDRANGWRLFWLLIYLSWSGGLVCPCWSV